MVRRIRYPFTAATRARPIPVFPLVASSMIFSFVRSPVFLGLFDHIQGWTIFNRTTRVKIFELG